MAQHLISRLSSRDYWNLGARFTKTPPNGHPCLAEFDLNRIAKAIASRSAVLWVGAGFSMAAGAPSWAGLMRSLLDIVTKDQRPNDSEREWCQELQKTENFLQLADYLSNALGNTLHEHIQDLLPPSLKPTSLHYELSRIPFDVIITTNYDSLIENSFRTENAPRGRLSIFTWKQPDAFLLALRGAAAVGSRKHGLGRSLPLLMKLHGTIEDRSTIILSSAGYRDIQHRSQQLRETLKHLLLTRQFLFVGTSLNDPHLLGLLDETLAEYGRPQVGDHYAILPVSEVSPARSAALRDNYSIRVIAFNDGLDAKDTAEPRPEYMDAQTEYISDINQLTAQQRLRIGTRHVINAIGGKVAQRLVAAGTEYPFTPIPNLRSVFNQILEQASKATGSDRGDICLIDDNPPNTLRYSYASGPTVPQLVDQAYRGFRVPPDCVCGSAFYRCDKGEVLYVPNVNLLARVVAPDGNRPLAHGSDNFKPDEILVNRFGEMRYVIGSSDMQSEIAVPVFSEGGRIGVLNLESRQLNAYANQSKVAELYEGPYKEVVLHFARTLGAVYSLVKSLQSRTKRVLWYATADPKIRRARKSDLQGIMRMATFLPDLEFILFAADYREGGIRSVLCTNQESDETVWFRFDQEYALAVKTFMANDRRSFPDAEMAGQNGDIDEGSRQKIGATGQIFGEPIYSDDVVAGVFVGWVPRADPSEPSRCEVSEDTRKLTARMLRALFSIRRSELRNAHDDVQKLLNLPVVIAPRAVDRIVKFFQSIMPSIDSTFSTIPTGDLTWESEIENVLLRFLEFIGPYTLMSRCRFFMRVQNAPTSKWVYECRMILTYDHRTQVATRQVVEPSPPPTDHNTDVDLMFLITRSMADPLTRPQEPDPDREDPFAKPFDKIEGRAWLASPIVHFGTSEGARAKSALDNLIGYMTFDDHPAARQLGVEWKDRFLPDDLRQIPIMCDYVSALISILLMKKCP